MQKGKFRRPLSAPEARKERSCQSYSASHIKWRAERSFHRPTFIRPDWNRAHGNLNSGSTERNFSLCVAFFLVPKHCSRSPHQKGINCTQVKKERMHWVRVRFTIWLYSKQNIQSVRYFKPFFNETEFELFMLSTVTTGLPLSSVIVQKSLKGQVIDS